MSAIPQSLMERLHQANQNFHKARLSAGEVGSMTSEQRESVASTLRAAEKELEDVTAEINALLPPATGESQSMEPAN